MWLIIRNKSYHNDNKQTEYIPTKRIQPESAAYSACSAKTEENLELIIYTAKNHGVHRRFAVQSMQLTLSLCTSVR